MEFLTLADGLVQLLGPGGAVAILLAYMEWKSQKTPPAMTKEDITQSVKEEIGSMSRQIAQLHTWHSKEDEDGVKVWYVRRSLERAIEGLTQAVEHLSKNQDLLTALLEREMTKDDK
jgi:CCR4-NOT transcriptional regulation complex NOT5 subunit